MNSSLRMFFFICYHFKLKEAKHDKCNFWRKLQEYNKYSIKLTEPWLLPMRVCFAYLCPESLHRLCYRDPDFISRTRYLPRHYVLCVMSCLIKWMINNVQLNSPITWFRRLPAVYSRYVEKQIVNVQMSKFELQCWKFTKTTDATCQTRCVFPAFSVLI